MREQEKMQNPSVVVQKKNVNIINTNVPFWKQVRYTTIYIHICTIYLYYENIN